MNYNQIVSKHFFNPLNNGELTAKYHQQGSGTVGDKALGSFISCQIAAEDQIIKEVKYRVFGNPYLIVLLSYLSDYITEMDISQVKQLNYRELTLDLEIPKDKLYSLILVEDVLNIALQDLADKMEPS